MASVKERRIFQKHITQSLMVIWANKIAEKKILKKQKGGKIYSAWLKLRMLILDRDSFRCRYCGRSPIDEIGVILHIDHKIPKSRGGKDEMKNLITSCEQCNLGKGDILLNFWKK